MFTYEVCVSLQTEPKQMKNNRIKGIFFFTSCKKKGKTTLQKHTYYNCISDKALNGKKQGHMYFTVFPITVGKRVQKK